MQQHIILVNRDESLAIETVAGKITSSAMSRREKRSSTF